MMKRLLLVEDDPTLRTGLLDALRLEGHDVTVALDGYMAQDLLKAPAYDLVILDVMLPGKGGLEILRDVRARGDRTPIILLTARSDENDRVFGLELGADDYVTKPFSLRELLARVRTQLRREPAVKPPVLEAAPEPFKLGSVTVDLAAFEVRRDDRVQPLTPREAAMIAVLWVHKGNVVTRSQMLEAAWEGTPTVGNRTIDTHMLNLRQKIEDDPKRPRHLLTVHGAGYRLVE